MSSIKGHPEAPEVGSRWVAQRDLLWDESIQRHRVQSGDAVVVLCGANLVDRGPMVRYIGEECGLPQLERLERWAQRFVARDAASPELLAQPQQRRDEYAARMLAGGTDPREARPA